MISYEKTLNNTVANYVEKYRQEWIQTNNPNSHTTSGYNFDYLEPEYTNYGWNGIAKASHSSAQNHAVITGVPGSSSKHYTIGAKSLTYGGILSINNHVAIGLNCICFTIQTNK